MRWPGDGVVRRVNHGDAFPGSAVGCTCGNSSVDVGRVESYRGKSGGGSSSAACSQRIDPRLESSTQTRII